MEEMEVSAVGIAWYSSEDYDRIRKVMADGHTLPPTYAAWLKAAQDVFDSVQTSGKLAVKANLRPDEFVAWCRERGLNVDSKARMKWGNQAAINAYRDPKQH